jgi:hypothetical protein
MSRLVCTDPQVTIRTPSGWPTNQDLACRWRGRTLNETAIRSERKHAASHCLVMPTTDKSLFEC